MSRNAVELLSLTCEAESIRAAVVAVRESPSELDVIARQTYPDPKDPNRQLLRRVVRWMVETPDIEWEGILK